jgi:hypothetical protein
MASAIGPARGATVPQTMKATAFIGLPSRKATWSRPVAKKRRSIARGAVRVYSELLVEANKNKLKARWNPEALTGLSGWR